MTLVVNRLRRKFYLDSVELMRLSAQLAADEHIDDAVLMVATENNKRVMADAGLLTDEGRSGSTADLVIAVRAADERAAQAALAAVDRSLDEAALGVEASDRNSAGSLGAALHTLPDANLALVSTPGEFAAREAHRALARGLNVMLFSDNVSLDDEISLKQAARQQGLLMMGPDCGTALIGGRPLAFCNAVPRGDVGVVAASGTGLQEVISLLARNGSGVSHALGAGGRDLLDAVGGMTTQSALSLLAEDPQTQRLLLVSKPPERRTAARIYAHLAGLGKPAVVCTLGLDTVSLPPPLKAARTLQQAVEVCLGIEMATTAPPRASLAGKRNAIHGWFTGGTLCSEALLILHEAGIAATSNVSRGAGLPATAKSPHRLIDLGADEYTLGRAHPMIDPQVRNARLRESLNDASVGLILLDVVLGYGAHEDPAGALVEALDTVPEPQRPLIIASVCGTDADPQNRSLQVARLVQHGVAVAGTNTEAARWAAQIARGT